MTENRRDFSEMRHTSASWFLFLCVLFCFVSAGSSSHHVQRRDFSSTGKHSAVLGTKMEISQWYLSVGDTVEINCTAHNDKGNNSNKMDLQLVWTRMGPGERTKEVLVRQRASKAISYVLGPVTHEHQGVYTCADDGSMPDVLVLRWHRIIWVADASQRASIDVISHNRSQFFNGEAFTVGCQLPNDDTQWKMMRFDEWFGNITECPNQVSSDRHLSCTTRCEYPWSDKLYWCETPAGERSNALNITDTVATTVVLESPPLPVLEGEDVMLRCLRLNKTTREITSNFKAFFYKNDQIEYYTEGPVILKAVTKADEGVYKCRHPKEGQSFSSWITVIARPDQDQTKKSDIMT